MKKKFHKKNEIDIFIISGTKLTMVFHYLDFLWQVAQFLSGLIGQVMWVEQVLFARKDILCKTIKTDCNADLNALFGGDKFKKEKMITLLFLQS